MPDNVSFKKKKVKYICVYSKFQMYSEWHISGSVVLLHLPYNQEKPQLAQSIGANSSGNYS